jgi:adenylate kinase family enzyme
MHRIVVFGASGSGKTSIGRWLGRQLALPFTDLDDVYWRPGWIESPTPEFRAAVDRITSGPQWVLAGNYSKARDLIWPRADTLIWLDLPLLHVLWRTTRRVFRQARTGELICNGNRQAVAALVTGRDSLLGYTLRTYHSNRRTWPQALSLPEHAGAAVVRLRSQNQVAAWQASLQAGNTHVDR